MKRRFTFVPENDQRTLFNSDTDPMKNPDIIVKQANMSGFQTSCAICDEPMQSHAGPWIYLDADVHAEVCETCGNEHDPETTQEMKDLRSHWRQ